tara:strand:- start:1480 stop:1713 length:234 start_codon:yes stop_codon:yes gene_type:complete
VSEEAEAYIHKLQSELTQIIQKICKSYDDVMSQEQVNEYLGYLIESLEYFHKRGNYQRMAYDLRNAINFLPSAFPTN